MKILILNPPAENTVIENPDEAGDEFLESDDFGDFPPLGALYVLSHCEKHTNGHEFFFHDCVGERITHKDLPQIISDIRPDVVGITSFTISLVDICMAAQTIRAIVPDVHLCLGGHHPIAYPFEAAHLPQFDSIVVGEGEVAFMELINALEKNDNFDHITGVYTAQSIEKFRNKTYRDKRFLARVQVPSGYVEEIDTITIPDRKYIRHIKYQNILGVTDNLATILSSRGCPYQCTFCDVPIKSYRQRDVDLVLDEVEECMRLGYTEFRFYDDLFNINEEKIIEFCDAVERRNMKFTWDFRGRVNGVTLHSLERAKKIGLRMIAFGVETGTDEGLEHLKKATTTEKIKDAFRWCRQLGILTVADYMLGLPTECDPQDVMNNVDFLIKLDPDYAQFSILTLYPNTQIYDEAVAEGLIKPERWQEWARNPKPGFIVDHWDQHMSHSKISELQKKAYKRFYFRPKYILRSILKTRSLYEFSSKAGGALKLMQTNKRTA